MSIDLSLLDSAELEGKAWLRLYQWDPHCLSFGRHEPALRTYDVNRIRNMGLDTVRRPTGGRAVWHARELTYAVAAPSHVFGSPRRAYLEIHHLLGAALKAIGVETSLAPRGRSAPLDGGACFSQPAGGEVLVQGRKVIGSAQLRRGTALLQHGSILLNDDQRVVAGLMRGSPQSEPPELELSLGKPASAVAEQIAGAARLRWNGRWERVRDPEPIVRAASLHFPQFRSSTWTWAR
jgi:lipoate-protein ligase A